MITPTDVSSRARSNASESSTTVSGRKALRTSGRSIVIFAMPSATSYLMSEYSPAGCQSAAGSMRLSTATCCLSLCWSAPTINLLDDWLTRRASSHAGSPALITHAGTTTYAQLDEGAARTARKLAARGVGEGDRVATTLPAGLASAELLHALPRLGASLVPLNTRLTAAERRAQLEDSGARLCVDEPLGGEEADVELRTEVDPES